MHFSHKHITASADQATTLLHNVNCYGNLGVPMISFLNKNSITIAIVLLTFYNQMVVILGYTPLTNQYCCYVNEFYINEVHFLTPNSYLTHTPAAFVL